VTDIDDIGPVIEEGKKRGYKHFNIKVAPNPDISLAASL